jgi:hypothetical protein
MIRRHMPAAFQEGSFKMVATQKQSQVKTKRPVKSGTTPRLPHEHDESDDSQSSGPRDDMKQAYADIENGQVDTDRRGIRGVEEVKKGASRAPHVQPRKSPGKA